MKVKKPKLKDYLKESKGQGLGQLTNQGTSNVTQIIVTRVVS